MKKLIKKSTVASNVVSNGTSNNKVLSQTVQSEAGGQERRG